MSLPVSVVKVVRGMAQGRGQRRITVDLGSADLHRKLKLAAVERDMPMREVIVEAIQEWLARQNGHAPRVHAPTPAELHRPHLTVERGYAPVGEEHHG